MKPEIEAKFLSIDHDVLRSRLSALGATCRRPMRLMRRKNYDFPDERLEKIHGWVRLRDEGDRVTLCYKQLEDRSLHGTKEVGLVVDDFAQADAFLLGIGLANKSYEETKRESWVLGDVQIELDEWPWIRPLLEIEGPTEAAVRTAAKRLGLPWRKALHGSVEIAYQAEYDVSEEETIHWPEILFVPVPAWLEAKRKQKIVA